MSLEAVMTFMVNTKAALKEIKDFKTKVKNATDEMRKNALSSILPAAGAFGGFKALKDVYDTTRKLADFSERFTLPVEDVSRFNNVLSLFGGTTETAVADIGKLEQAIVDLRTTGGGALRTVANQIGLSLYDNEGKIKGSLEIFESIRDKFKELSEFQQLKVAQELGLDDPATLRMLRASDEEYAKMTAEAEKMNIIGSDTARKVQTLNRLLATMRASWQGIGATVLGVVLKPVEMLSDAMRWLNNQSEDTQKIILGVSAAIFGLAPAISVISYIVNGFSALSGVLGILSAALTAVPVITFLAAIAAGVYYIDDITTAIDRLTSKGTPVANFFKSIKESVTDVLKPIQAIGEGLGWIAAKITGANGTAKPIEQMSDAEYAEEYGVSIDRAKEIRENRRRFMAEGETLPTSGERRVMQSQTQNVSADNSSRTIVQNITVNADSGSRGRDIAQKTANASSAAAKNVIYQNAGGIRR